jgi:hypothetical protein
VSGSARRCPEAGGAEDRVDDRVGEHVGVGVAREAQLVRDLDAAEDQAAIRGEAMRVDADARADAHPMGSMRRVRRSKTASSVTPRSSSSSSAWS